MYAATGMPCLFARSSHLLNSAGEMGFSHRILISSFPAWETNAFLGSISAALSQLTLSDISRLISSVVNKCLSLFPKPSSESTLYATVSRSVGYEELKTAFAVKTACLRIRSTASKTLILGSKRNAHSTVIISSFTRDGTASTEMSLPARRSGKIFERSSSIDRTLAMRSARAAATASCSAAACFTSASLARAACLFASTAAVCSTGLPSRLRSADLCFSFPSPPLAL